MHQTPIQAYIVTYYVGRKGSSGNEMKSVVLVPRKSRQGRQEVELR